MRLKFDNWNIEIIPENIYPANVDKNGDAIVKNINAANMTIDLDIIMETANGSKFKYELTDIKVENLTYDAATIEPRILNRLKDFEIT